jgi:hypothetical protein
MSCENQFQRGHRLLMFRSDARVLVSRQRSHNGSRGFQKTTRPRGRTVSWSSQTGSSYARSGSDAEGGLGTGDAGVREPRLCDRHPAAFATIAHASLDFGLVSDHREIARLCLTPEGLQASLYSDRVLQRSGPVFTPRSAHLR